MKIIAITQARISSTRLPAKVLKEINGKTLLQIHLERAAKSKLVNKIIVATTVEPGAEKIAAVAEKLGFQYYMGSVNDVLARFYEAAKPENPDYVVRITSDCPLIDAKLVDKIIQTALDEKVDYASNTIIRTYPDGVDAEVFTFAALEKAYLEADSISDREHVTPYIWRNSTILGGDIFTSVAVKNEEDLSGVRITVDTQEDFDVVSKLVKAIGDDKSWKEYIPLLKNTLNA